MPPHGELAPPAAHRWQVHRQDQKAEWKHPKAQHRQETQQPASDEEHPGANAERLRARQMKVAV